MRKFSKVLLSAALLAAVSTVGGLATGAQAQGSSKIREVGEAKLAKAIAGREAGEPVSCINFRDIRSSRIISGTAIIYEGNNGVLYVNRPASGAAFLRTGDALITVTSLSQLCNVDIVRLFDTGSRFERGSIGLGQFVPYPRAKATKAVG
ncbi:hypothetical protein [Sphingobium algorifonticola]|uniref:hypothetical protein n=1 Tax=Sphingobium algorifonticola TaxID=2008318 RepID=UPI001F4966EA|nr:hypothetical protein [Sphingobium algorifonticola]